MKYLPAPVVYLDTNDFDNNGYFVNPLFTTTTKPVFIMIQANYCFHCTDAKPHYYRFAINNIDKVVCATIQGDSDLPEAKALRSKMNAIYPQFQGYPSYIIYYNNQRIVYNDGRDEDSLTKFLNTLLIN